MVSSRATTPRAGRTPVSYTHLVVVLVIVALVLFGSTQIPKLARSLGSAQREFKKGVDAGPSDGETDSGAG